MPTGIKLTKEKKESVVNIYIERPMSLSELGRICNLSIPTIIKILDEYSIERYKKAQVFNPNLKEHFFDNIDCEIGAYFLGFIITDGNIFLPKDGNRQASISITQSSSDEYILEAFKNAVQSNTAIGHDGRGCSQIAIRSNIMAKSLEKYGIVSNKTLITKLPLLQDELMPHLLRGIFDGDGNIKAHQTNVRNRYAHALSFCGTHTLMQDINDYLCKTLLVNEKKVYDYSDRHLSEIKWQNKEDMKKIGDWMYRDATIYLVRKHELYNDFINHYYS